MSRKKGNSPPTLIGAGHQRTVSTNTGCKQWFSLARTLLKVALVGRDCSLVARTSKCGWAISHPPTQVGYQSYLISSWT